MNPRNYITLERHKIRNKACFYLEIYNSFRKGAFSFYKPVSIDIQYYLKIKSTCFLLLYLSVSLLSVNLAHAQDTEVTLVQLTTVSNNPTWSPTSVRTEGQVLRWQATADAMTPQTIETDGIPTFNFSVSRSSPVTVTVTTISEVGNLLELVISDLEITSLDITNSVNIRKLSIVNNQIRELDLSQNIDLVEFFCSNNDLFELDVSLNSNLSLLVFTNNPISQIDLSDNLGLNSLNCGNTPLRSLDLSNNINLNSLICSSTFIKELDLSNNTKLIALSAESNELSEINIKNGTNEIIQNFNTVGNPNLFCVQVDDVAYSEANWLDIDAWTEFKTNCGPENEPPVAVDDSYTTLQNRELTINESQGVLSNDIDPEGDLLIAELVTDVSQGNLFLSADGSFSYFPNFDFTGVDTFSYRAFDGQSYSNSAVVSLLVEGNTEMVVPNAFTPNNDDLNDTFRPVYQGFENVQLSIYDTWGNLVYFESGEILSGWDGSINNKRAENGNYLYRILAITNLNKEVKREGILTLIR